MAPNQKHPNRSQGASPGLSLLFLILLLFQSPIYAADSGSFINHILPVVPTAGAASCSFYFSDIYSGTMSPVNYPSGSNAILMFNNNGSPIETSPALPCNATYRIVFTIDLQATSNIPSITVMPTIIGSDGNVLYPPAAGPSSLIIYPQCNNSNYSSTPNCTMNQVSGSVTVSLNAGLMIWAPVVISSDNVNVTGGQFTIYLYSSP